jgi:serine/threonine-protein kinase
MPRLSLPFVTIPPPDAPATTLEPTSVGEELPPDLLSDSAFQERYSTGQVLGEGGMGVVRTCTDRRIGREVAIKSAKAGKGSRTDLAARFLREAYVQGQLEHPAIVPVYDLGRDLDGTLYFTMKRVRGMTFERIVDGLRAEHAALLPVALEISRDGLEDGTPSHAEAVRGFSRRKLLTAFASACHAVDFAHSRGVIHRDLKPGNVMLGDFGEVYVLDWGLAKIVGVPDPHPPSDPPAIASDSSPGTQTVRGATMGTPGYMAPEQARGDAVDTRADVYALGAILFELLALEPIHPHASARAALESTLAGPDPRPSRRAPNREIPPELDAICVRAMAPSREDRYSSVRALVDDLERYLDGDRDLAQRRELGRDHARAAEEHAARALAGGEGAADARRRALHEVGRAIAIDPTNDDAVRTLMRLMTEMPTEIPEEARDAMLPHTRRLMRAGTIPAMVGGVAWLAFSPLFVWMGMRSWTAWAVTSVAWVGAAVLAIRAWRRPSDAGEPDAPMTLACLVAFALSSMIFGPYLIVPALAVLGATLLQAAPSRAHRVWTLAVCCLVVALPVVLQLAGVLPASYAFDGGAMTIVPIMVSFPPALTHVVLLASSLLLIVVGSVMHARFRDMLTHIEQHLHVQAWQLRQLVPERALPSSPPQLSEKG